MSPRGSSRPGTRPASSSCLGTRPDPGPGVTDQVLAPKRSSLALHPGPGVEICSWNTHLGRMFCGGTSPFLVLLWEGRGLSAFICEVGSLNPSSRAERRLQEELSTKA